MRRLLIVLVAIFLFFPILVNVVYANDEQATSTNSLVINYEATNPSDGFTPYAFKRLKEKATLALLSFSPLKKADYYEKLLGIRLAELKYVVDKKEIAFIEIVSQRYSATIGQYTEFLIQKRLDNKKDLARQQLGQHLLVVENLKNAYDDTTAEWRFVKHDIDYLRAYLSQL